MIPFIIAGAGTAISAYGAGKGGAEARAQYEERARVNEVDAQAVERLTEYNASQMSAEARRLRARQIVQFAKAGVLMAGTPGLVVQESERKAEQDRVFRKEEGRVEAQKLRMSGLYERRMGSSQYLAGLWGAGSALAQFGGQLYKPGANAGWWGK